MRFKTLFLTMLLALALVAPSYAATSLTATTLSVAVTNTQTTVTVASASGMVAGWYVYVDREAMLIRSISGTILTVSRGVGGTAPAAHGAAAGVLAQVPYAFFSTDVSGSCSTVTEEYLPHINLTNGSIYDCVSSSSTAYTGAGYWVRHKNIGFTVPSFYATGTVFLYTSGAAIMAKPGVHLIGGTAQAYTLAAPAEYQNGMVITIVSTVAQTNTVTVSGGVDGTSSHDACAFAAAIGNHITLVAIHGAWYLIAAQGITVS